MNLRDYEREIDIRNKMIKVAKKRKEELVLALAPKGYGSGRSYVDADNIHGNGVLDYTDIIEEISHVENEIYLHECVIEYNKNMIAEIKGVISNLSGLKCKVKNMQMIEGKNLKEIADELGYTHQYIREVAVKEK